MSQHQSPPPHAPEMSDSERQVLRRRTEGPYRSSTADLTDELSCISQEKLRRALHELEVYQVELEMQNEELRRAQAERDTSQARYFDFYDMAPVGYCTVTGSGLIEQANLTAATLLGKERKLVLQQEIAHFIFPDDQDNFYLMRQRIIETRKPHSCELRFVRQDSTKF